MQLMYKKFTAALLAFLMIFSMGGMLRPLAQTNTSQPQTSQEPKVNGDNKVYINETNFPDPNFRQYLLDNTNYTTDDTGKYYTEDQIATIVYIDCCGATIENLKGIEYFTALMYLLCEDDQITSLDLSKNTSLNYLNCEGNQITSLDVSKNTALGELICCHNQLTSLDISGLKNLTYWCIYDQTPNANCYYITNKLYIVFMSEVLGKKLGKNANLTKVNITSSGWNYNPNTGIASYSSNGNDAPSNLRYNYAIDDKGNQLEVNAKLNIR